MEPRHQIPCIYEPNVQWQSLALSSDGDLLAVAADYHVWIWHLSHPVSEPPLNIEISHKTKACRFDAESSSLFVDAGAGGLPTRARGSNARQWTDGAHDEVCYRSYRRSEDCVQIPEDNKRPLYLPREFRPRDDGHPKLSWSDEVAFMDSIVAI